MKTKFLLQLLFLVILNMACNKYETVQPNDIFPNKIGYQWVYKLTSNSIDTVNVEIVGQGTLPNGVSAKIWKYTYKFTSHTYIDTVWVSCINNNVRIYNNPCWNCTNQMPSERLQYILPLRVGESWYTNAAYGDTTKVIEKVKVSLPAGKFKNVFCLTKVRGPVTNSFTYDTIYFKEQLGLVKLHQNQFSLGPLTGNGIWELISYDFDQ